MCFYNFLLDLDSNVNDVGNHELRQELWKVTQRLGEATLIEMYTKTEANISLLGLKLSNLAVNWTAKSILFLSISGLQWTNE